MGEINKIKFFKIRMSSPSEDKAVGFFTLKEAKAYIKKRVEALNNSKGTLICNLVEYNVFEHPYMLGQVYDICENNVVELPNTYISLETMYVDASEALNLSK